MVFNLLKSYTLSVFISLFLFCFKSYGSPIYFDISFGTAIHTHTEVSYIDDSGNTQTFSGHFDTRPLKSPPYYGLRLGYLFINKKDSVEIEFIHNKLYGKNLPDNVQKFEITDGYNHIFLNYVRDFIFLKTKIGLGTIWAHPDIKINNVTSYTPGLKGYQFDGFTFQMALQKNWYHWQIISLFTEVKYTISQSKFDLTNGEIDIPNQSVHFNMGLSFSL